MEEMLPREAWHLHPHGADSEGLVTNISDVVEVLTNGRYRSIEHRAVVNEPHERVSMAAFHPGRFEGTFGLLVEAAARCATGPSPSETPGFVWTCNGNPKNRGATLL
jgi:isopenicillin N synthase-like dioxygenase